jgi:hypothetical protein
LVTDCLLGRPLTVLIISLENLVWLSLTGHGCERGSSWARESASPDCETENAYGCQTENFLVDEPRRLSCRMPLTGALTQAGGYQI